MQPPVDIHLEIANTARRTNLIEEIDRQPQVEETNSLDNGIWN
jgi:hypothetical protein